MVVSLQKNCVTSLENGSWHLRFSLFQSIPPRGRAALPVLAAHAGPGRHLCPGQTLTAWLPSKRLLNSGQCSQFCLPRFSNLPPLPQQQQDQTKRRRGADDFDPRMPARNVPATQVRAGGGFGGDRERGSAVGRERRIFDK